MIATTSAAIAVSTATAASDGVEVGDLNIVITPSGKTQLADIFEKIEAACGLARLKSRQAASCAADYIENKVAPEVAEDLLGDLGRSFVDGAGNLIEYTWIAVEDLAAGAFATGQARVTIGTAFTLLAFGIWKQAGGGSSVPDAVKIPSKNIATQKSNPSSIQSSKRPGKTPPPVLYNFYNSVAAPVDTASADALAFGLQARLVSLSSVAALAASTVQPNACKCTQLVSADGTLGNFDCVNLGGNDAKCDVSQLSFLRKATRVDERSCCLT